ncbi:MAG: tRNA (adenosine(37)-N6)-dimethylallyltransferase MiaA [Treponema sp.]|jgi:tRNA dimethylallyltransferase|nr:tRNA (adenosine(37)-N6)-dimethylallyltransferase MiaA [Treponema sp.]
MTLSAPPEGGASNKLPVCVFFGPTASGKTALLEELFAPPDGAVPPVQAEVISADSMQVYRGMDIGTAKPPLSLREKLPHHLVDIRNPDEQFNAGDFVRLADEACREISARGRLPVISGGTGFYLKNFICGLSEAPPPDRAIRAALSAELAERGPEPLMAELTERDPESAARIHANDTYRLLRALEVCRVSCRPLGSFAPGKIPRAGYRFLIIGIRRDREELYRRVDARCGEMFRAGLPAEVRRLFERGYTPADPGMRAIGYREFFVGDRSEDGPRLSEDIEGVRTLVARNSRRYVKRQLTFFASIPGVTWISAGADAVKAVRKELERLVK